MGAEPFNWSLFGISGTLNFTAGVLRVAVRVHHDGRHQRVFGVRGVRLISWIAVGFIAYAFLAAYAAISLAPAAFWVDVNEGMGVPDIQKAYAMMFGQGMWTICGSIIAFLVGQLIDVVIFHRILRVTGERFVWLRATASTAVSQLLDSFIVLYIAFVIGPQHWSIPQFLAMGTVNYVYKMCAADRADPAAVRGAYRHSRVPRARRGGAAAARSGERLATFEADRDRADRLCSCLCGCGRPALRPRCRCADRAWLQPCKESQPDIMSAAPMPRIPPPPRFAAFTMTTPSQTSSVIGKNRRTGAELSGFLVERIAGGCAVADARVAEHFHRRGDVVVH